MKNDYFQELFSNEFVKQFTENPNIIPKIINEPIDALNMEKYERIARGLECGKQ